MAYIFNDIYTSRKETGMWRSEQCDACSILAKSRKRIVVSSPPPKNGILAVGEAPGADEDEIGEGFVGTAGKTLDKLLMECGIAREFYGRANICRCRPPENRKPKRDEADNCIRFLAALIEYAKPSVIIAVGGTPAQFLCGKGTLSELLKNNGNDWSAENFSNTCHPTLRESFRYVKYIVPMPHTSPLAFNRNSPWGEKWSSVARKQIRTAVELLKRQD